jgi:sucrose-6-phosphate hydrolase SacC (GH32 family)
MAVLAATLPGMPLVYGGQESVLDRRLAFFEKDPIAWKDTPLQAFYTRLLQLKQREPALANGDAGGALEWLDLGHPALLAFRRERGASRVSITVNLSAQTQANADLQLPPWGWHIQTGADDPWRPRFHFSAAKNWINDPNGLIFVDGEYHLFYQYNPFGDQWGHMSWGHAVSRNLMQWQELPVAIPEDERVSIFSGSVVIDAHNSSGFGDGRTPPLVAIYTGCLRRPEGGQALELAWSTDRGRTWTKYTGNPVLDRGLRDFRDPKVFWHAGTARWIMLVSVPDERRLAFYESVDLKAWTLLSHFDAGLAGQGIWECPDLFELPVDGEAPVWVLKVDVFEGHPSQGSGARLFLGRFDGRQFTLMPQDRPLWADHGADFYAALSWANLGRRAVWIGWMNCHRYAKLLPTRPWRGAMSMPRDLSLKRRPVGLALCQWPVPELTAWHGAAARHAVLDVASTAALLPPTMDGRALDIEFMVSHSDALAFGLRLRAGDDEFTLIGYDRRQGVVFVDRTRSGFSPAGDPHYAGRREAACPGPAPGRPLRLRVLVDHSSVELFIGEGEIVITEQILPRDDSRGLLAWSDGGRTRFEDLRIAEIQRPSSTRP